MTFWSRLPLVVVCLYRPQKGKKAEHASQVVALQPSSGGSRALSQVTHLAWALRRGCQNPSQPFTGRAEMTNIGSWPKGYNVIPNCVREPLQKFQEPSGVRASRNRGFSSPAHLPSQVYSLRRRDWETTSKRQHAGSLFMMMEAAPEQCKVLTCVKVDAEPCSMCLCTVSHVPRRSRVAVAEATTSTQSHRHG